MTEPVDKTSFTLHGELAEAVVEAQQAERPKSGGIKGKSKKKAQVAIEAAWAFDMQLAGYSLRAISDASVEKFGKRLSPQTVWRRVEAAIAERVNPRVDQLRAVEDARYDHYLKSLQDDIDEGDEKAINAALRIAERRARLHGLDAPVKVGVDATVHYVIEGVDTSALR